MSFLGDFKNMQAKQIAGAKAWREEGLWGLWRMGERSLWKVTLDEIERGWVNVNPTGLVDQRKESGLYFATTKKCVLG